MKPTDFSLAVALALLLSGPSFGQDTHAHHADPHADHSPPEAVQAFDSERLEIAETSVFDQSGVERYFRRDVLGDGPVVVTFVYTSCTTVCPLANAIFQAVQRDLDAVGDTRTRLISVSVDPVRDTPPALRRVALDFGAGPRWTFVSGRPADISRLLRSFGLQIGALEEHDPMFLVGRAGTGQYTRIVGLPDPETLVELAAKVGGGAS